MGLYFGTIYKITPKKHHMIQSKKDYKQYLEEDRISSNIPQMSALSAKIKQFLFPNHIWEFLKALRWLEYCENVKKIRF